MRLALLLALSATSATAFPQNLAGRIRAEYTKSEQRVPMRDGVHLHTAVYRPKDKSRAWPILLCRTPYGVRPYGADVMNPWFLGPSETPGWLDDGYVFVYQDVRGRMMSEGEFEHMAPIQDHADPAAVDPSTDAYDTIEWLLANVPGHNGRVGMWGGSYDGFYAAAALVDAHPALLAVSPQAPQMDWWFEDFHHNGVLCLADAFAFLSSWGGPHANPTTQGSADFEPDVPDGYRFFLERGSPSAAFALLFDGEVAFWDELSAHPDYDAHWRARSLPQHLSAVRPATLFVGGWFDANNLRGTLVGHGAVQAGEPTGASTLIVGPWGHAGWQDGPGDRFGDLVYGEPTGRWYRSEVERPFFRSILHDGESPDLSGALAFDTGRGAWRRFDAWPPEERGIRNLYLARDGALADEPPSEQGRDAFVSDPARPVPVEPTFALRPPEEFMTGDQRFVSTRPDVLSWRTPPLDAPFTAAGPTAVELFVSTSGADADWIVKLVDVEPSGVERLVRWEVMRTRYRGGFEYGVPGQPGAVVRLAFELQDVLHTFEEGHHVMVQVQSSWFPLLDRNPQTWVGNTYLAEPRDYAAAIHRVHHSPAHPSRVRLGALPPLVDPDPGLGSAEAVVPNARGEQGAGGEPEVSEPGSEVAPDSAAPGSSAPEPADPESVAVVDPVDPAPSDPVSTDPEPSDPEPIDPTPADPTPAAPTPADPAPVDPPAAPRAADPATAEPATTDPAAPVALDPETVEAPSPADAAPRASFTTIDDLPGGEVVSEARALSANGLVVAGRSSSADDRELGDEAFRWSRTEGLTGLAGPMRARVSSDASAVSADGATVVGRVAWRSREMEAFRWTATAGTELLGDFEGGMFGSQALCVSADGSVIGGWGTSDDGYEACAWIDEELVRIGDLPGGRHESSVCAVTADGATFAGTGHTPEGRVMFLWTATNGFEVLGDLAGGDVDAEALAQTPDGAVVVGRGTSARGVEAVRWTRSSGFEALGDLAGGAFESVALAVSADGAVVAGAGTSARGTEAFVWTREAGMRRASDVLAEAGLGAELEGWTLTSVTGVSADGRTFAGTGTDPAGVTRAWHASVPPTRKRTWTPFDR